MTVRNMLGRSGPFWVAMLALAAYWAVAPRVEDNIQTEWVRSFHIVALCVAGLLLLSRLIRLFGPDVPGSSRRFFIGLVLFISGAAEGGIWRLLWRMAGRGDNVDWMLTNDFAGFLLWIEVVGLYMMLSGIPVIDGGAERANWRRLALTGVLCLAAAWIVVSLRPDVRGFLDEVKPWIVRTAALIM